MANSFNIFRLNCMMDDSRSKNYNSVLVSLVSEILYERGNVPITRSECYALIENDLKINIERDLLFSILEKSKHFEHTPVNDDVLVKLTSDKFRDIEDRILNHSIGYHIELFREKRGLPSEIVESITNLLYQSIFENINSFTVKNVKSLLPINNQEKYKKEEINAFNDFLDDKNLLKNTALFNIFLKAIEFAILTSGKGVKEFTKDIFEGKTYCLDANIIFRMLGVGGEERKESLIKLLQACTHQGIKFTYTNETYREFKRKMTASLIEMNNAAASGTIAILQELLREDDVKFNDSFLVHYIRLKSLGKVKSPDQYETLLLSDFRIQCKNFNIQSISTDNLKQAKVLAWSEKLFTKKKEMNGSNRYTKTAAKVDATNVLLVRELRGQNDYNYSDIKSFYLTTDRTLNTILAKENEDKIAETILPSQLFILHNSLYDNGSDLDYDAFNKFLKRRTTEFKYSGQEVLTYINEIRNYTNDTENIKEVIRAYSDKKYETSLLEADSETEYRSIREFAKLRLDEKLETAESGNEKFQATFQKATDNFSKYLIRSKRALRTFDFLIIVAIIPITILALKEFTANIYLLVLGVILVEGVKFAFSNKFRLYEYLTAKLFLLQVKTSRYYKITNDIHSDYLKAADEFLKTTTLKIWG